MRTNTLPGALLAALLATTLTASAARAGEASSADTPHVRVELLSAGQGARRGGTTAIGVAFDLEEHWHVYWKYPGDSGAPPVLKFAAPGARVGALQWPVPERIVAPELVTYGYHGGALITASLTVPPDFRGDTIDVRADLEWLVCDAEGCIPGFAELSLTLPVVDADPGPSAAAPRFAAAKALVPRTLAPADALVHTSAEGLLIEALDADLRAALKGAAPVAFIPELDGLVSTAGARRTDDGLVLLPRVGDTALAPGSRVAGVLAFGMNAAGGVFALDTTVTAAPVVGRAVAEHGGEAPADDGAKAASAWRLPWPLTTLVAAILFVGFVWNLKRARSPSGGSGTGG